MPATLEQAVAAVRSHYGDDRWLVLDASEQTRAIYREMRRLDLEETMNRRALARATAARPESVQGQHGLAGLQAEASAKEPLRCSAFIKTRIGDRCTWQPVVVVDGKHYCGFHNPQRRRAGRELEAVGGSGAAKPLLAAAGD